MRDDLLLGIEDYSTEDKVRYVALRVFSSYLFLGIALLNTIPTILQLILLIYEFSLENVIVFIIPLIFTICIWKTYIMAKKGKVIDTGGLRVIKLIITIYLILIGLIVGFLVIYTIIAGFLTFLVIIPLSLTGYALYIFKEAISTAIATLEDGSLNTDYYASSITWLIVFMVINAISYIIIYSFDPSSIPQLSDRFIEALEMASIEIEILIPGLALTFLNYLLLIFFIRKLKYYIERIETFYPKINNIQIDSIAYKISSNVLESDSEINDVEKY